MDRGLLLYPNDAEERYTRRLIGGAAEGDVVNLAMWMVSLAGPPQEFLQRWDRFVDEVVAILSSPAQPALV